MNLRTNALNTKLRSRPGGALDLNATRYKWRAGSQTRWRSSEESERNGPAQQHRAAPLPGLTLVSISPVPRYPCPIPVIVATNPCPMAIWRGGTIIDGCWCWNWSIVVRSTGGTKWSAHNSCCCPDDGPCHSQRKKKRVAVVATIGPGARSGNNHKKSKPDGR